MTNVVCNYMSWHQTSKHLHDITVKAFTNHVSIHPFRLYTFKHGEIVWKLKLMNRPLWAIQAVVSYTGPLW